MAKYVYHVPGQDCGGGQVFRRAAGWGDLAYSLGKDLQNTLAQKYGICAGIFPEEDGVELDQGCAGMGKDWFNFKFRVFADSAIYLDMINIPYEWRHRGIGEWLVGELKSFAGFYGLRYIFLGSYEPANPFWEGCGFVKITEYPDFVLGPDPMAK